jgi:hypothetical protein
LRSGGVEDCLASAAVFEFNADQFRCDVVVLQLFDNLIRGGARHFLPATREAPSCGG